MRGPAGGSPSRVVDDVEADDVKAEDVEAEDVEAEDVEAEDAEAEYFEIPSPPRTRTGQSNEHRARTRLQ